MNLYITLLGTLIVGVASSMGQSPSQTDTLQRYIFVEGVSSRNIAALPNLNDLLLSSYCQQIIDCTEVAIEVNVTSVTDLLPNKVVLGALVRIQQTSSEAAFDEAVAAWSLRRFELPTPLGISLHVQISAQLPVLIQRSIAIEGLSDNDPAYKGLFENFVRDYHCNLVANINCSQVFVTAESTPLEGCPQGRLVGNLSIVLLSDSAAALVAANGSVAATSEMSGTLEPRQVIETALSATPLDCYTQLSTSGINCYTCTSNSSTSACATANNLDSPYPCQRGQMCHVMHYKNPTSYAVSRGCVDTRSPSCGGASNFDSKSCNSGTDTAATDGCSYCCATDNCNAAGRVGLSPMVAAAAAAALILRVAHPIFN